MSSTAHRFRHHGIVPEEPHGAANAAQFEIEEARREAEHIDVLWETRLREKQDSRSTKNMLDQVSGRY